MILKDLLEELRRHLEAAKVPEAAFEARRIFEEALHLSSAQLIARDLQELTREQEDRLRYWTKARINGEPLAYLSGRRGFYKFEFLVEPGVLIPRPETELVVEQALKLCAPARIADYGCGSGCIGLSLAKELPRAELWSVDSSPKAIEITLKNAEKLGVSERTQVIFANVESWRAPEPMDLIVANPPYIAEGDPEVEKSVRMFEPHAALYSGPDGLAALRAWTARARQNLRPGGVFVSEFGAGQSAQVREIMSKAGFEDIQIVRDLAGHDRVVSGRKA